MTPALSSPARWGVAAAEVETIVRATQLRTGAAVLDLGCGAGVHAVAFAARGFRVTGVDRSPGLLWIAKEKHATTGGDLELVRGDMRTFVRPAAFDLACSLNSSFAYFDDAANLGILENVKRCLRSDGVFVVDTLGEGFTAGESGTAEIGGALYSVVRRFDATKRVLEEDWSVTTETETKRFHSRQRIYSAGELRTTLLAAGFEKITISCSLDGLEPYSTESVRLVAIAG